MNKIYLDLVLHSSDFMCNKNTGNMFWVHSSNSLHAMIRWDAETNHLLQLNSSQLSWCSSVKVMSCLSVLCPVLKFWTPSGKQEQPQVQAALEYYTKSMQRFRHGSSKRNGLHIVQSLHNSLCCFPPGLVQCFAAHSRW